MKSFDVLTCKKEMADQGARNRREVLEGKRVQQDLIVDDLAMFTKKM